MRSAQRKRNYSSEQRSSKKRQKMDNIIIQPLDEDYWIQGGVFAHSTHPTVKQLLSSELDTSNQIGSKNIKLTSKIIKTTLHASARFPKHVVLLEVGEFVEAHGMSALALIDFGGLRAMGNPAKMRAGTPKTAIKRLLSSLLRAGLKVAVYCESINISSGAIERKLAQVVSAAAPLYLFATNRNNNNSSDSDDSEDDGQQQSAVAQPVVVVAPLEVYVLNMQLAKHYIVSRANQLSTKASVESWARNSLDACEVRWTTSSPVVVCEQVCKEYHKDQFSTFELDVLAGGGVTSTTCSSPLSTTLLEQMNIRANGRASTGRNIEDDVPNFITCILPSAAPHLRKMLYTWIVGGAVNVRGLVAKVYNGNVRVGSAKDSKMSSEKVLAVIRNKRMHNFPKVCSYLLHVATVAEDPCEDALRVVGGSGGSEDSSRAVVVQEQLKSLISSQLILIPPEQKNYAAEDDVVACFFTKNETRLQLWLSSSAIQPFRERVSESVSKSFEPGSVVMRYRDNDLVSTSKASIVLASRKFTSKSVQDAIELYKQKLESLLLDEVVHMSSFSDTINRSTELSRALELRIDAYAATRVVYLHLQKVVKLGWKHGTVSNSDDDRRVVINGIFPYWMSAQSSRCNTFTLENDQYLLTAPNASGKTSLMRSVLVACLLNRMGLFVPVLTSFSSPLSMRSFHLRLPGTDRPSQGLSSFSTEAKDIADILRSMDSGDDNTQQQQHNLVLLDELGRGSCPREGVAFAQSVVEYLSTQSNVTVIFATHLHDLLDRLPTKPRMTVDVATHTVVMGASSRTSLSVDVMELYGVPVAVTTRARELLTGVVEKKQDEEQEEKEQSKQEAKELQKSEPSQSDFERAIEVVRSLLGGVDCVMAVDGTLLPPIVQSYTGAVYIIEEDDGGGIYIGETKNVLNRRQQHAERKVQRALTSKTAVFECIGGKTQALKLEACAIKQCIDEKIVMSSVTDGNHVY
jgi:predicted GIY-YIG superfamily endonuclease